MRFEGKVAVLTGAALGIGRAAAAAFAAGGANVAILDLNKAEGERAVKQIQGSPDEAMFFKTDVSKEAEVQATMEQVVARWGRLDILVNNAGIYFQANALDTPLEIWERVLSVNLTGAFLCTKHAVQQMVKNGGGVVVNVASEAGLVGIKGQVAYNVSKGGLIALTRSCAVDFAELGVRVNSICPGTTNTPLV